MGIFANPFFSRAGQVERIRNVGSTLKAAFTGQGVKANTGNRTADAVLGAAASNPYVTALGGAVAVAPKTAGAAIASGFRALPKAGKVATFVAAPVVIGAVATNPSLVVKAAETPKELSQFGSDVGGLIADPSLDRAKQVAKNSPLISAGLGLAGAAAVGGGAVAAVSNIANTRATRRNTEALQELLESPGLPAVISPPSNALPQSVPLTPETQVIGRPVSSSAARRKRKAKKQTPSTNVRIQLLNQNTYIEA